jgi:hypothetical protein
MASVEEAVVGAVPWTYTVELRLVTVFSKLIDPPPLAGMFL